MKLSQMKELIKNNNYNELKKINLSEKKTHSFVIKMISENINNKELVEILLSLPGLDLNTKEKRDFQRYQGTDMFKNTFIGKAIKNENLYILDKLHQLDYDFNLKTPIGYNYLTYAINCNAIQSVHFFINNYTKLITNKMVNGDNNLFYLIENKNMNSVLKETFEKSNFNLLYTTNYGNNLFKHSFSYYNENNFSTLVNLTDEDSLLKIMTEKNYELLWESLYNDVKSETLKKITDVISKKINLENITYKDTGLNFYEMCALYCKTDTLKIYKNYKFKEDFTKLFYNTDRIKSVFDNKFDKMIKLNNLDSNLLYLIKNKFIKVDLNRNFKFNPFSIGLIKTGTYFYNNTNKFKNISIPNLIKGCFYSSDYIAIDYDSLFNFIKLLKDSNKLNYESINFLLQNINYGPDDEKESQLKFKKYIHSVFDLAIQICHSDNIKGSSESYFKIVFLLSNIEDTYNIKNKDQWSSLLEKGTNNQNYKVDEFYSAIIDINNKVYINDDIFEKTINLLHKTNTSFFTTPIEYKEQHGLFISKIFKISQQKLIEHEKNLILGTISDKKEHFSEPNKKRRF